MRTSSRGLTSRFALTSVLLALLASSFLAAPASSEEEPSTHSPAPQEELVDLRTESSRTFANDDGSYTTEMFPGPIHFKEAAGEWKQIDNTFVPTSEPGFAYENAANAYRILIPENIEATPVRMEIGSEWIEFRPHGATGAPVVNGSTVTFPSAIQDVDLLYQAENTGVEELFRLHDAGSPNSFEFDLQTSAGLTPDEVNGEIILGRVEGTDVAFADPVMYEENDPSQQSQAVALDIAAASNPEDVADALVDAGDQWLNDPQRSYPVLVDPTVTLSDAPSTSDALDPRLDCSIRNDDGHRNDINCQDLRVGTATSGLRRSLIRFPIPGILKKPFTEADDAQLSLYVDWLSGNATRDLPLKVHRVLPNTSQQSHTWNECVTWNNRSYASGEGCPSTINWTQPWPEPGGSFVTIADAEREIGIGAVGSARLIDTTDIVDEWLAGTTNNGFLLKAPGDATHVVGFGSTDDGGHKWPSLTVKYRRSVGVQVHPWDLSDDSPPDPGDTDERLPKLGGGYWGELEAQQEVLDRVDEANMGWVRIDVGWATFQKTLGGQGDPDYIAHLEGLLRDAEVRGLKVLATLWYTPDWAIHGAETDTQAEKLVASGGCREAQEERDGIDPSDGDALDGKDHDWCRNNHPDLYKTDPANPAGPAILGSDQKLQAEDAALFGDFASKFVTAKGIAYPNRTLGSYIDAYEIWNEPDLDEFWAPTGDPRNYDVGPDTHVKMLEAVAGPIRAGDSTATIMNGGPSLNDPEWISNMYAADGFEGDGPKDDFDVLATHAYVHESDNKPECTADEADAASEAKYAIDGVRRIRQIMTSPSVNDEKTHVWFTEFGWFTGDRWLQEADDEYQKNPDGSLILDEQGNPKPIGNTTIPVSKSQQADFAVRALDFIDASHPYVRAVFWYNSHDRAASFSPSNTRRTFGLLERNLEPKPSYTALSSYLHNAPVVTTQEESLCRY
jgi:hypothetical protein